MRLLRKVNLVCNILKFNVQGLKLHADPGANLTFELYTVNSLTGRLSLLYQPAFHRLPTGKF